MACSHRLRGQDKTVLSCPCRRCEQALVANWKLGRDETKLIETGSRQNKTVLRTQLETRQNCLVSCTSALWTSHNRQARGGENGHYSTPSVQSLAMPLYWHDYFRIHWQGVYDAQAAVEELAMSLLAYKRCEWRVQGATFLASFSTSSRDMSVHHNQTLGGQIKPEKQSTVCSWTGWIVASLNALKVQWHQIVTAKSVLCHPGLTCIFHFWHSGILSLRDERQSARMSEIKNVC